MLLTHKKPERAPVTKATAHLSSLPARKKGKGNKGDGRLSPIHDDDDGEGENQALRSREEGVQDRHLLFQVGDTSDDEDDDHYTTPSQKPGGGQATAGRSTPSGGDEGLGLINSSHEETDDGDGRRTSDSSDVTLPRPEDPFRDDPEEYGDWEGGARTKR